MVQKELKVHKELRKEESILEEVRHTHSMNVNIMFIESLVRPR